MTIERLQAHYGFTRMPFGRSLAPQMLHRHASHAEAAARIGWCISEGALGVVTGEVGAGSWLEACQVAVPGGDQPGSRVVRRQAVLAYPALPEQVAQQPADVPPARQHRPDHRSTSALTADATRSARPSGPALQEQ